MTKPKKDQPQKSEVEARVDAMMDVNSDGIVDTESSATQNEPIDIFAGAEPPVDIAPSAPPLPTGRQPKVAEPVQETVVAPVQTPVAAEPVVDDVKVPEVELDTPQTSEAIDDIVAQEADEVLAAQDAGIERELEASEATDIQPAKHSGHPVFWLIIALLVAIAAAAAYILTSPGLSLPFGL